MSRNNIKQLESLTMFKQLNRIKSEKLNKYFLKELDSNMINDVL